MVTVLLTVLLVGGLLLLRFPQMLVPAAQWGVARFTPLRLELSGLELDIGQRQLRFAELHLYQRDATGPALVTVLEFSGHSALTDLWRDGLAHTDIAASSVVVYVAADDNAEDPSPEQWLQYLRFLPREVRIGSVHLINKDRDARIFPLHALYGRRSQDQQFRVTAQGIYEGEPLDVELAIAALDRSSYLAGVDLKATLTAPANDSTARLEGQFRADSDDIHYNFSVDASFEDVGHLLRAFEQAPPLAGALSLQGRISGSSQGFALTDAAFELDNRPAYRFEASGDLQGDVGADPALSLIASGEMDSMDYFLRWLDLDLSPLGSVRASIALSGSLGATEVDQLTVVTQSGEGLWITLNGSSGPGSLFSTRLPKDSDFTVHLNAPALAVLNPWLSQPASIDPGPWQLSARLLEDDGTLKVEDIKGRLGQADTDLLQFSGQIATVNLETLSELATVRGIELQLKAGSTDLARPASWFELTLPPGLALEASAGLVGNGAQLEVVRGNASLRAAGITLTGSGFSASLPQAEGFHPQQGKGQLQLTMATTSALGPYLEQEIPALGAVRASARLQQRGQRLDLLALEAQLAGEFGKLAASGSIRDLAGDPQLELAGEIGGLDAEGLGWTVLGHDDSERRLPSLSGEFALAARPSSNTLTLSSLQLASSPQDPLQLALRASATVASDGFKGALQADYASDDTALLERLSGLRLAPINGSLTLTADQHHAELEIGSSIGATELALTAQLDHTGGAIDSLSVSLESPLVQLMDLGLQAETDNEQGYKPAQRLEPVAERSSLQRALEEAPRFPLELRVALGGLRGEQSSFDDIRIHITGEQSQYVLREFDFSYAGALAEIRGIVDISLSPPGLSVAGQASSIPLNTLSQDLGLERDISGSLNVRGGLSAQGITTAELLAHLNGSMGVALEDATVEGAAYDVLATGLLTWLFSGAALEKSTDIDCTMARFTVADGIARSDDIYVESSRMIATGQGEFDLPQQQMQMTLTPRSRSRAIQIPSKITLRGAMASPRVTVSPITTTLNVYTEVMLFLPRMIMKLFGIDGDKNKSGRTCQVQPSQ